MIVYFPPLHARHAPPCEIFRGERVPCFETPERAAIVHEALRQRGDVLRAPDRDSTPTLGRVHAPSYLAFLESAWVRWLSLDAANADRQPFPSVWPVRTLRSDIEPDNFIAQLGRYSFDNGTPISAGTWLAAKQAADAAVSAVACLGAGEVGVLSAGRPPGHHAGRDFMGGYCFLNHAAVAAEALREAGCRRVAILDVDYHHGNGTQSLFYDRADVLYVSIHGDPRSEYPFYLGYADEIGVDAGAGFNLNLPLPAGSPVADWFAALDAALARIADFRPEALVVSLGLDTYAGDPISRFALQAGDFRRLGRCLRRQRLQTAFILEGGYAVAALGANAASVIDGFEEPISGGRP